MTYEKAYKECKEFFDNDGIGELDAIAFNMALNALEKQIMTDNKLKSCEMVSNNPMDYVRVALALETLAYHNKNYLAKHLGDNCEISREIQSLLIEALKESERRL